MKERLRILPGFVIVTAFSALLYSLMLMIQNSGILGRMMFSYEELEQKAQTSFIYKFFWFLGDMTEAQFYKSITGSIGLILFSLIAYILYKRKSKWAGFSISYNSGLWPWVFISSTIGLAISVTLYIQHLSVGWIPTFVAFVSIPAGVVLLYGGGWKNTLTGSILGGMLGFPIAWFVIKVLLVPLNLPNVIGNVTGMWLGAIIVFEICHYLPWMKLLVDSEENINEVEQANNEVAASKEEEINQGSFWYVRRVLADFTEPQFFANELATIGLLLGAILGWLLNPNGIFYGSGVFPALLFGQFLTLAISNFLYFNQWKELGWYPTFVPVVSVAPAIIQFYDGSLFSIVSGAFLGALIAPPIAQMVIRKIPNHWHPVVGNTFSMALSTFVIMIMLDYMI